MASRRVLTAVLWLTSRVVPRHGRAAWRQEWTAEFAHDDAVRRPHRTGRLLSRLAMAARHAWWLRWNPPHPSPTAKGGFVFDQIRHAWRTLLREPSFTWPALVTLALGIGANVAVFSVVEAVLLRPLPYPSADRLVVLRHRDLRTNLTKPYVGSNDIRDLATRQHSFESVLVYNAGRTTMYGKDQPVDVQLVAAGPELFAVTAVQPLAGRAISADDCRPKAAPVVLLGYEFWQEQFGGDPSIVGRAVRIGSADRRVIGIMPANFRIPRSPRVDAIGPLPVPATPASPRSIGDWAFAIARLKPGVTLAAADTELRGLAAELGVEFPATNRGTEYYALTLRDSLVGDVRRPLLLMMAAVAVVLLIAFANVGNLLLVRAMARRGELALRLALGASRGRLFSQLLIENLLLAAGAAAAGVTVAVLGTTALVRLVPPTVAVPALETVGLNPSVLGFGVLLTLLAAVAFSVFAALYVDGRGAARALVSQRRHSMSRSARRTASSLVVVEVALAVILLIGAGLILRSFRTLLAVHPGFDRARVSAIGIQLPAGTAYSDEAAVRAFYRRALPAVRAVSGVESVGLAVVTPLTGNNWTVPFERADRPLPAGQRAPDVGWQSASGGYFTSMGIPLKAGRAFNERDAAGPPVVIISESVARRFFDAAESPVGRRVKLSATDTAEIVGVVGDIRRAALSDEPRADMYFSLERQPGPGVTLFVRSADAQPVAGEAVRAALRAIEPNLRVEASRTLDDVAEESAGTTRLVMWLLSVFGVVSLTLAAIGVYGVMSYSVRQRLREFATRAALGARGADLLWLVMKQGGAVAALGLGAGLAIALFAARTLESLLFGVTTYDAVTFTGTAVLLALATFAGCYLPARRAARVEPARTLAE